MGKGAGTLHGAGGDRATPAVQTQARLRLAEISLRSGQPADCLAHCRQLATALPADPKPILHLMGRAYEALGSPGKAAECFGGTWPNE